MEIEEYIKRKVRKCVKFVKGLNIEKNNGF